MRNVGYVHNIVALKSYSGKGSEVMTYSMLIVIVYMFHNISINAVNEATQFSNGIYVVCNTVWKILLNAVKHFSYVEKFVMGR